VTIDRYSPRGQVEAEFRDHALQLRRKAQQIEDDLAGLHAAETERGRLSSAHEVAIFMAQSTSHAIQPLAWDRILYQVRQDERAEAQKFECVRCRREFDGAGINDFTGACHACHREIEAEQKVMPHG
jgi:hypothetical protein